MKKIFALLTATLLVFPSIAFAIPGMPNQFYGAVTVNGSPATNGTIVEAKIGSTVVLSKVTTSGKYGYNPNVFIITDQDNNRVGQTIAFFVQGVDTGKTAVFSGGMLTKLDLSITTSTGGTTGGTTSGTTGGTTSGTTGGGTTTNTGGGTTTTTTNGSTNTNTNSNPPVAPVIPDAPAVPAIPDTNQGQVLGEKITAIPVRDIARIEATVNREKARFKKADTKLLNRLKGRIYLQVQEAGEAWYIPMNSTKKFYLADGPTAFEMLSSFGLGISNKDLDKIPVGIEKRFADIDTDKDGLPDKLEEGLKTNPAKADTDGDGVNDGAEVLTKKTNPLGAGKLATDTRLITRLKGHILLQVQSRGEAWYLNPVDGKRYYMKSGDAAFNIMRYLSSGITNADLAKIDVGEVK